MRSRFDEQLELLNRAMIEMGALCEQSIQLISMTLNDKDKSFANEVSDIDDSIREFEKDIENRCLKLLLHQQPVAKDLRVVSSVLKMITDMGRIGTQANNIAEIIETMDLNVIDEIINIKEMANATKQMVFKSVDAYVKKDLDMAYRVVSDDDQVDAYFENIKRDLTTMIKNNSENVSEALDFLMISKYFERIGDHAANIAEWVIYSVTGEHKKLNL